MPAPPSVPISEGSEAAHTLEIGPLRLTRARFPGRETIAPHTHDRPVLAFMLGGSFDLAFRGRRTYQCVPGSVFIEPAGETHCNCMGTAGAHVLVLQPDPDADVLPRPVAAALLTPAHLRDPGVTALARRMAAELATPDAVSGLALEALALEALVRVTRAHTVPTREQATPWLRDAEEILRARFLERLTVADLAAEVGVHPAHLARAFRRRHHVSVGRFVRSLRLEWAAHRLAATAQSIAAIALEAGYVDQSHFTRRFREFAGTTPGSWRRAHECLTRSGSRWA
jgi:AraC family transcriptional regulator